MPRYRSQTSLVTAGRSGIHSGTSAPSPAHVGQRWFNTATAVTYQYTRDAAGTKFWLDISSGGIGAVASRSVDWVGDTDPHLETNGSGLAVGDVYYNREADRYFTCTTATTNANVWAGRFAGSGGIETTYKSGSDFYRVHTFLGSGTFEMDSTTSVDYLVVAGGGGASSYHVAGGGGAGGLRTAAGFSTAAGTYAITVGAGGLGGIYSASGSNGGNSVFSSITATGGGGGSSGNNAGLAGGSGGGGSNAGAGGAASPAGQGNAGGAGGGSGNPIEAVAAEVPEAQDKLELQVQMQLVVQEQRMIIEQVRLHHTLVEELVGLLMVAAEVLVMEGE